MKTAIFIRSYSKDFLWLDFCLRSIEKYCSGFEEVVLVVPKGHSRRLNPDTAARATRVVTVKGRGRGYLCQQITKINAHKYTGCEQILFVDSDCIFFAAATPDDFMKDGKPHLLKTPYDAFDATESVRDWQGVTKHFIGGDVSHEWMRRLPLMHKRSVLADIEWRYPDLARRVHSHGKFSEFNFIGEFVSRNCPNEYTIEDTTESELPGKVAHQYWSWGGMSMGLQQKLECVVTGTHSPVTSVANLTHRNQFGELLNNLGLHGEGVEVGVARGQNAKEIMCQWESGVLNLVDPYVRWPDGEYIDTANKANFQRALQVCKKALEPWAGRCVHIFEPSQQAVSRFADKSLDFVYLDGNHHEPQISQDLEAWYPKVRSGGIFGGHDFYSLDTPEYRCEVELAVKGFAESRGLAIHVTECSSWWMIKP